MTQAELWESVVAHLMPQWTILIHSQRARWLLDEAAVWQTNIGLVGVLWRFDDGSQLCANEYRHWVIPAKERAL